MVVGLGTGSTTFYAMERLSGLIEEGLRIQGVPTSFQTEMRARQLGIPLTTLDTYPELDLAIDGADKVDPLFRLIKGRGAAMTREKCVAAAAGALVIVVDASKCVTALERPGPARGDPVCPPPSHPRCHGSLEGSLELRNGIRKDGPVITDNGNFILDCSFGEIPNPNVLKGSSPLCREYSPAGCSASSWRRPPSLSGEKTGAVNWSGETAPASKRDLRVNII